MKISQYLYSFLILALSANAFCWEFPKFGTNQYVTKDPTFQSSAKVIQKDGRCSFAVVIWPRPHAPAVEETLIKDKSNYFRCVGDIVLNPNTLQEVKGCASFILDGNTLQTTAANRDFRYDIAPKKACAKGGFEELVSPAVGDILLGYGADPYAAESIVIFSSDQKYLDWYQKAKPKRESEIKTNLQAEIKKNGYPKYFAGYANPGVTIKEVFSGDPLLQKNPPSN